MMKQVIGALLAAAALVPVAAQAQGRDKIDDGRRPSREQSEGDGQREARQQQRVEARQQARAERADQPVQPVQPQPRAERPRFQAEAGGEGGWRGRRGEGQAGGGFRGQVDTPQLGQVPDRSERRRDWQRQGDGGQQQPRPDRYRDRVPDRGTTLGGARFEDRSRIDTRSRIDMRSRFDNRAGYDDRGRFDNRTNYDNRRIPGRAYDNRGDRDRSTFDQVYNGNGRWNRDWRGDNRYDWNRYRAGNRNAFRLPRYYSPYGWDGGYRRFSIGVNLSSVLWSQDYWIDDPYAYRLPEAYEPYRWVRYYNDALLVDLRSGYIVDTVYGIFY